MWILSGIGEGIGPEGSAWFAIRFMPYILFTVKCYLHCTSTLCTGVQWSVPCQFGLQVQYTCMRALWTITTTTTITTTSTTAPNNIARTTTSQPSLPPPPHPLQPPQPSLTPPATQTRPAPVAPVALVGLGGVAPLVHLAK